MRLHHLSVALAVAALAIAGCGGDDDDGGGGGGGAGNGGGQSSTSSGGGGEASGGGGGGGTTIQLAADPGGALKFDKTSLTAKAGKVTIDFDNPSSVPHAVEVEGNGAEGKSNTVTGGKAEPLTLDLKAGTYEFYCPVDGHKQAGMKGTLTVN
jgi:plastocyanin